MKTTGSNSVGFLDPRGSETDVQNLGAVLLEILAHGPRVTTLQWAVVQLGNHVPDLLTG